MNKICKNSSNKKSRKGAFTLAEALIAMAIIGVVAAITVPTLMSNITERTNSDRQANIALKITKAMELMRAHGELNTRYESTDAFVDELQKYLKIQKRCKAANIADCWPTSTVTGNDEQTYAVSATTTRSKLHMSSQENNNNVGLVFTDGASIILTYNIDSGTIDVGDSVTAIKADLPVGGGRTMEFPYTTSVTGSIDFVMDVNGSKSPNQETTADRVGDIRSFKAARFGADCPSITLNGKIKGMCVVNLGTTYNCISEKPRVNNNNCWAGAREACKDIGMRLPSRGELNTIYAKRGKVNGVPTDGWFWSYEESEPYAYTAYVKYFDVTGYGHLNLHKSDHQGGALCVGNY